MHPIHPRTTMVRRRTVPAAAVCLSVAGLLMMPGPGTGQDHGHPEGDASRLGAVTFPVSCDAPVTRAFERAVAMLHSFWFEAATREFEAVVDADPDCAMGRWGIAMTMMGNPMARTPPSSERQRIGRAAAERARALAERTTERERMYADAVVAYYAEEDAGFSERMAAHEAAMRALHEAFPDDPEATTFYA
ncbi:MAG TPA: hypothetical protein VK966_11375, partial [Longimicrobiales bacterium]|nr:hypothetical protein [Longimicrobiales bacterium]